MRRLIISLVLVAGIIALSITNTVTLYHTRQTLTESLNAMEQKLDGNEPQVITEDARAFQKLWMSEETKLVRFIRHTDLEQITWDSARLPYLAEYGDMSELTAEINRIRMQVDHLWETQTPRWHTIF